MEKKRKKKEICKKEGGKGGLKIENGRRENYKMREDLPFFFFFFFSLLKMVKNLFWVYQKWKFSTGKKHFTPRKNSGKMNLPPQKNFPVMPLPQSS